MRTQRQADGRQRISGRVTPSKMRRNAVIAVDGVLALGAGALGGLFATGTATATAPTPGWTGAQSPLPSGPDAPKSPNPEASWYTNSCVSAAFCAAGGSYLDGAGVDRPLLGVESGGTWSVVEAPIPAGADSSFGASITSVSCPSEGVCVATGYFEDASSHDHALVETLSGGTWSAMDAPLPGDATGNFSYLKSVDCQSAGSCVAVGDYKGSTGSGGNFGLIDTLSGGVWSSQPAPQPADAATHQDVFLKDVSCPSSGPCAAVGYYENGSNDNEQALVYNQTAPSWTVEVSGAAWRVGHRHRRVQLPRERLVLRHALRGRRRRDRHLGRRPRTAGAVRRRVVDHGHGARARQRRDRGQPGRRHQRRVVHVRRDLHCRGVLQTTRPMTPAARSSTR